MSSSSPSPVPQITATPQEQSAFTMHCWNGAMDDIKATLAKHPDAVHWRHSKTNDTGLTHACARGAERYDVAQLLLDNNADMNVINNDGMSALMLATVARDGSEAHVALLLSRGADQTLRNKDGQTAEEIARTIGRPAVAAEFDNHRILAAQQMQDAADAAARAKQQALDAEVNGIHAGTKNPVHVRRPITLAPKRR